MALIEVGGLSVALDDGGGPVSILDDVSFAIEAGESLGLVGESGCGKTMTALALIGLLPDTARAEGSVLLDGAEILNAADATMSIIRGRRISMIFQEPMTALNPVRAIGDQVAEGPRWHLDLGARAARSRAAEMLDRVGLPQSRFPLGLYPHELSGGQRQRVMIAMALAVAPDLLIADEPTTALDVSTQARILDLIVEMTHEEGAALLLITHDMGVIAEMTDRMIVMYAGTMAECGRTADVFAGMAHPYTRGLFDALPAMDADPGPGAPTRLRTIPGQVGPPPPLKIGCAFAGRCRRAEPRCRANRPPPIGISPGHVAWCFYPEAT